MPEPAITSGLFKTSLAKVPSSRSAGFLSNTRRLVDETVQAKASPSALTQVTLSNAKSKHAWRPEHKPPDDTNSRGGREQTTALSRKQRTSGSRPDLLRRGHITIRQWTSSRVYKISLRGGPGAPDNQGSIHDLARGRQSNRRRAWRNPSKEVPTSEETQRDSG